MLKYFRFEVVLPSRKWERLSCSWRNSRDEIRFYRKRLDNWCSRTIENAWRCAPECERN